jgi:predicted transcriptional regulator
MIGGRGGDSVPEGVLDDIAYISRSESRVTILDAIAAEPYSRSELEEMTGIARTTVGRIINAFEERGWARRTSDGAYTATPPGERMLAEFKPFVQSVQVIRDLGELVAWLPIDEVAINLRHFADVTIHRPDPADPMSTVEEFTRRLDGTTEFQCLVRIAPPIPFEQKMRDGVVDRDMATKHVITNEEFNYLLDFPERVARWREYLEAGANVYRYDGGIPCNIFVFDDTVIITNTNSEFGDPHVGIESGNEEVLSWAQRVIETYRREAERLDSTAFSASSEGTGGVEP